MSTYISSFFYILIVGFMTWSSARGAIITRYYSQPVDHFGYGSLSMTNFNQKVLLDYSYGIVSEELVDRAPILVYFGGEARIESWVTGPGILTMAATHFQSLVVYIEHRFYGESIPYGSIDLAIQDVEVRGCLTSVQALADFADVILDLKTNLSMTNSPVIVMGGSYGGMLAAWFRLKYPHIAVGALASSAPIITSLELPVKDQYCSIVSRDFRDTNTRCFDHISKSWALIDRIAMQPQGLKILAQTFKTCSPLFAAYELKDYLAQMYRYVAQYNGRFSRINLICDEIAHASEDDILGGISRATFKLSNEQVCNNISWMAPATLFYTIDPDSQKAWGWQMCSELLGAPNACSQDSMFEPHTFNISDHIEDCRDKYGVYPHTTWLSTYYGGQDLKSALKTFGSNIIFSNGLKDPLSGASILQDISDTIVAINTRQGSHCLDLSVTQHDDPKWLKHQREKELKIMSKWVNNNGGFNMRHLKLFSLIVVEVIVYCVLH